MTAVAKVATYMTPCEGELARLQLAQAGIESRVESNDLLVWLWHVTNASRGASLVVRTDDRQRALRVLHESKLSAADARGTATRDCPQCSERLPSDWEVCWRCGTDSEGHENELFFHQSVGTTPLLEYAAEIDYLPLLILLVVAALVLFPPFAIVVAIVVLFVHPTCDTSEYTRLIVPEGRDSSADASLTEGGDEACRRAMASSIFGFGWLPPLTIHSLWLLITSRQMPISGKGRLWRNAAWTINVISVAGTIALVATIVQIAGLWDLPWVMFRALSQLAQAAVGSNDPPG